MGMRLSALASSWKSLPGVPTATGVVVNLCTKMPPAGPSSYFDVNVIPSANTLSW